MGRRLAIIRKSDIKGVEGLEDCYVQWTPVTYGEAKNLKTDHANDDEAYEEIVSIVMSHFAGGKIRVINEETMQAELTDMIREDVDLLPSDVISQIFMDMTGVSFEDPKALSASSTEKPSSSTSADTTEPPKPEASITTTSSEDSPKASRTKSTNE